MKVMKYAMSLNIIIFEPLEIEQKFIDKLHVFLHIRYEFQNGKNCLNTDGRFSKIIIE